LGYPVFSNEPHRLEDIAAAIERLGVLAGTDGSSRARAREYRGRLAQLRELGLKKRRVRVFYQVWGNPLLTVNANHVISDALAVCGADNIFERGRFLVSQPSREAILLADPEAIIVAAVPGQETESIGSWQRWGRMRAVSSGNVYAVDPNLLHRHTGRILDGVGQLCAHVDAARGG